MQTKSETRNPKSKPKAPIPKSEPPSRFPVPQDGFTYEREAIEASLQHRERSPKTNLKMGRKATRRFCDCGAFFMFCLIYGSWLVMKAIAEMMSSGMWILSLLGRSRGLLDTAAATFDGAVSFFRMFRVDGLQEVRTSWVWERSRLITQYRYIRTPPPPTCAYISSMHKYASHHEQESGREGKFINTFTRDCCVLNQHTALVCRSSRRSPTDFNPRFHGASR